VVSEAITNAVKHGSARQVSVTVSADGRGVTVSVTNDGRPFKATRRRSGLANLEERARRRGGSTTIGATADGTRLTWQVPVGGDRATSEDTKAG
jgi:signal transduction histidine kinase